jgi:hypothetical protein
MTKSTTFWTGLKTGDDIAVGKMIVAADDQDPSRIERQFSGYIVAFIGWRFFVREASPTNGKLGRLGSQRFPSSPPSAPR